MHTTVDTEKSDREKKNMEQIVKDSDVISRRISKPKLGKCFDGTLVK